MKDRNRDGLPILMHGVREYAEGDTVEIGVSETCSRLVVRAWAECRNRRTEIDLIDLVTWLRSNWDTIMATGLQRAPGPGP